MGNIFRSIFNVLFWDIRCIFMELVASSNFNAWNGSILWCINRCKHDFSVGNSWPSLPYCTNISISMESCTAGLNIPFNLKINRYKIKLASLIAYLTSDWRRYLLSINIICLPVLILMLFWRESPRWLIQKRRPLEACKELNAISSFNRCSARFVKEDLMGIELNNSVPKRFVTIISLKNKFILKNLYQLLPFFKDVFLYLFSCKIYSFLDLFATKNLALYSIVMIFSALTVETSVAVIIFDVQVNYVFYHLY